MHRTCLKTVKFALPKFTTQQVDIPKGRIVPKGIVHSNFLYAWNEGYTGKNILVAVVDTGIDSTHNDLQGKIIKSVNLTTEVIDNSHGTHVAGTIVAAGKVAGGAPDAKIMDIKVITKVGASISNIVKAIRLAGASGCQVINMSLGGSGLSSFEISVLTAAINDVWNQGCICVAAAGNAGTSIYTVDPYSYPASVDIAQSVGACSITIDGLINLAPFSNENDKVDCIACGVDVLSTTIGNNYAIFNGTSMAAPHVTAMIALLYQKIKEQYPLLNGADLSKRVIDELNTHIISINGQKFINYSSQKIITGTAYYNNNKFLGYTY